MSGSGGQLEEEEDRFPRLEEDGVVEEGGCLDPTLVRFGLRFGSTFYNKIYIKYIIQFRKLLK